jgi:hypothetical protein
MPTDFSSIGMEKTSAIQYLKSFIQTGTLIRTKESSYQSRVNASKMIEILLPGTIPRIIHANAQAAGFAPRMLVCVNDYFAEIARIL